MKTIVSKRRLIRLGDSVAVTLPREFVETAGIRWIRRRVATTVRKVFNSDIDEYRFMRWAEPRELGILAYYDQTRYEVRQLDIGKTPNN